MAAPGGDAGRSGVLTVLATTAGAPAGGWCSIIGKAPGSPVTADDVAKIARYARDRILDNPVFGFTPFGQWAIWTEQAIIQSLQPWVVQARSCDTIPNNLTDVPGVQEGIPGSQGAGPLIQNLIDFAGLGDVFIKGAVLVGIIVLLLMAIRRVLA